MDTYVNVQGGLLPDNIENFGWMMAVAVGSASTLRQPEMHSTIQLSGRASIFTDTLDGGLGADTYIALGGTFIVDNPGDKIIFTDPYFPVVRSRALSIGIARWAE